MNGGANWMAGRLSSSRMINGFIKRHNPEGVLRSLNRRNHWVFNLNTSLQDVAAINKKLIAKSSLSSSAAGLYLEYFVKNAQVRFSALAATSFFENQEPVSLHFHYSPWIVSLLVDGDLKKWLFPCGERALVLLTLDSADRWSHGHWKLRVNIACVLCKPNGK